MLKISNDKPTTVYPCKTRLTTEHYSFVHDHDREYRFKPNTSAFDRDQLTDVDVVAEEEGRQQTMKCLKHRTVLLLVSSVLYICRCS